MRANPLQPAQAALRFVLEFAAADVERCPAAELHRLALRVRQFTDRQSVPGVEPMTLVLSRAQLAALQAVTVRDLRGVVSDRAGITGRVPFWISTSTQVGVFAFRDGDRIRLVVEGKAEHRFRYQLFRLLEETGPLRLAVCSACDRLFIRVTRKRFCSTRCQSRVYMQRYRRGEVGGE